MYLLEKVAKTTRAITEWKKMRILNKLNGKHTPSIYITQNHILFNANIFEHQVCLF